MANIYDNPLLQNILFPKTPELGENLYDPPGIRMLASTIRPEVDNRYRSLIDLMPDSNYPEYAELDKGATGIVPLLENDIPTILNKGFINAPQDYYGGVTSLDPQRFQAVEDDDLEASAISEFEEGQLKQSGGVADLLRAALGFVVPGANFFLNKGRDAMSGIRSLNQRLRNTDFGQSRTGAEFAMRRRERKQAERAQEAMPDVYKSAREQGFTNDRGGFSTSRADRSGTSLGSGQFSSKRSTGRQGY